MGFLSNAFNWIGDNLFGIGQTAAQVGAQVQTNAVNQQIADANMQYQREANAQNIALTREQNALNRAMTDKINSQNIAFQQNENAITRAREDNAVQRRASDLQSAGLSKTLSAGSPASASPLTAPQAQGMQYDRATVTAINNQRKYESALMKLNLADNIANFKLKMSEVNKNNAQADNFDKQGYYYDSMTKINEIVGEKKGEEIDASISYTLQQIAESKSRVSLNNENILKMSYEIAESIAREYKLGLEAQMIVYDMVGKRLSNLTNAWNLSRYLGYGTPTNFTPSKAGQFAKEALGSFGGLFDSSLKNFSDELNKIYGY